MDWVSITINSFGVWDRKEAGRINILQGDLNFKTSLGVEFTARPEQQMASVSLAFESRGGHAQGEAVWLRKSCPMHRMAKGNPFCI